MKQNICQITWFFHDFPVKLQSLFWTLAFSRDFLKIECWNGWNFSRQIERFVMISITNAISGEIVEFPKVDIFRQIAISVLISFRYLNRFHENFVEFPEFPKSWIFLVKSNCHKNWWKQKCHTFSIWRKNSSNESSRKSWKRWKHNW